jgi:hypothetical protein
MEAQSRSHHLHAENLKFIHCLLKEKSTDLVNTYTNQSLAFFLNVTQVEFMYVRLFTRWKHKVKAIICMQYTSLSGKGW